MLLYLNSGFEKLYYHIMHLLTPVRAEKYKNTRANQHLSRCKLTISTIRAQSLRLKNFAQKMQSNHYLKHQSPVSLCKIAALLNSIKLAARWCNRELKSKNEQQEMNKEQQYIIYIIIYIIEQIKQ